MESEKIVANFTSARAVRIVSPAGDKCQIFEPGETALVHRDLWSVAIAAGLMPEEPLTDQVAVHQELDVGTIEVPVETKGKSQEEIVSEGLLDACKTLIARGNPNDFTQMGQPRTAAVKKLVDFDFTANDVRRAFDQAMFEVEKSSVKEVDEDGNDST